MLDLLDIRIFARNISLQKFISRKLCAVAEDGLEGSKKRIMSVCSKCAILFTSKPMVKEHLEANHTKIANTNVSLSNSWPIDLPSTKNFLVNWFIEWFWVLIMNLKWMTACKKFSTYLAGKFDRILAGWMDFLSDLDFTMFTKFSRLTLPTKVRQSW